jgi:hypothetical protein
LNVGAKLSRTRGVEEAYYPQMNFWKKFMGRRDAAAARHAEEAQVESPAERRESAEGVDGVAADEFVQQGLGGVDPDRLVDDEFKP